MMHHRKDLAGTLDAASDMTLQRLLQDAPAGLTEAELGAVAAALNPRWCLAPHQDPAGELMAVILPTADDALPGWVIHREGALLRLDACAGDAYTRLGAYPALAPLLSSLCALMAAAGRP